MKSLFFQIEHQHKMFDNTSGEARKQWNVKIHKRAVYRTTQPLRLVSTCSTCSTTIPPTTVVVTGGMTTGAVTINYWPISIGKVYQAAKPRKSYRSLGMTVVNFEEDVRIQRGDTRIV